MRIGFFNSYKIWGGGEKWHFEMAQFCQTQGDYVVVFSPTDGMLAKRSRESDLIVIPIEFRKSGYYNPFFLAKLLLKIRHHRLDVLVFNSFQDVRFAALVAKMAGVKKTVLRGGLPMLPKDAFSYRLAFRWGLDYFIANCQEIERLFRNSNLLQPQQILPFLTNGIDIKRFTPVRREKTQVLRLGNVARLSDAKGLDLLISVVSYLQKISDIPFMVEIAGTGELEQDLKRQVVHEKLDDVIKFVGHLADVVPFLQSLDIVLFTSRYEGASNAIIEMMGCGLPLVAFDTSSMHDMIESGSTGFLVPAFECKIFAEKVVELMQDKSLRDRLGTIARKLVEQQYCAETNFKKWHDCLSNREMR